ncbi:23S rRNA (guanosine(2251)-2'-O)-methyltransferase RlmB [soil metagenome]
MRNYREQNESGGDQMIYGIRPVMEAVEAGKEIERIFINRLSTSAQMKHLKQVLRDHNINWQEVPVEKLSRLTKANHQDVICYISQISYAPVEEIVQRSFNEGKTPLFIVLDYITDVRNFGAIARTAECCGADALIIPATGSAQINADAVKTSAGALHIIPVCKVDSIKNTLLYLRESGLKIYAATEKGKTNSFDADFESPCAIIMGSEDTGVSNDLLRLADDLLKIPLTGQISSLNVSVACGMLLHEVLRQRSKS